MCLLSLKETYSEVSNELIEELLRYWNVKLLILKAFIIVERSGKLSEIKFMTSLLVSSRNAGNLKLFWFQTKVTVNFRGTLLKIQS